MKKWTVLLVVLALILTATIPTAAATSGSTGQTTVFGTFPQLPPFPGDEPDPVPVEDDPEVLTYEINIPAVYNTLTEEYMVITAQNVSIGRSKKVVVYLDGAKTLDEDGTLILYHTEHPEYKAIGMVIRTPHPEDGVRLPVNLTEDTLVASFLHGSEEPDEFGYIIVKISATDGAIRGEYGGTLYFKITVEDL